MEVLLAGRAVGRAVAHGKTKTERERGRGREGEREGERERQTLEERTGCIQESQDNDGTCGAARLEDS